MFKITQYSLRPGSDFSIDESVYKCESYTWQGSSLVMKEVTGQCLQGNFVVIDPGRGDIVINEIRQAGSLDEWSPREFGPGHNQMGAA